MTKPMTMTSENGAPAFWLTPEWPLPPGVGACQTTRLGGVSLPPYQSLNLGLHVQDEPQSVAENRRRLAACLPAPPLWLNQVHGTRVVAATPATPDGTEGDGGVARAPGRVCAIMTADCLPVLFCARDGSAVGAAHAGWRGLAGGVLEATVAAMEVAPDQLSCWLGPAIGPRAFEVGDEVRAAFLDQDGAQASAFQPGAAPGKWLADIYALARRRLNRLGLSQIYGGGFCTVAEGERFFSYRREKVTGRMASLIWLTA